MSGSRCYECGDDMPCGCYDKEIRADERAKFKLAMGDDGEHYVTINDDGWFIAHTVDCRIAGMENCEIHQARYLNGQWRENFSPALTTLAVDIGDWSYDAP